MKMKTSINVNQLFTNKKSNTGIGKAIQFPLSRIVLAILFIAPVIALHNIFSFVVLDNLQGPWLNLIQYTETIMTIILIFIAYSFYTKKIENRKALELSTKKWFTEFATGFSIGGGTVILIVLILVLFGFYKTNGLNSPFTLVERIFRYGIGSFVEEIFFTLIIFKLIEEFAGTIISMVFVSLLFGAMHLGNDNASIWNSIFMALEHVFILAPFILTRRIWMVWAIHFSWNYFQTGVFGMNNSGMEHTGYIQPAISGPNWATGGNFGIEASYITIALNIVIGLLILFYAVKKEQMVKPIWNRLIN